jgi:hypothetical protein
MTGCIYPFILTCSSIPVPTDREKGREERERETKIAKESEERESLKKRKSTLFCTSGVPYSFVRLTTFFVESFSLSF